MKIKTSDLIGPALDWAVATCEGFSPFTDGISWIVNDRDKYRPLPAYSTDWARGGPIIEREEIILGLAFQWSITDVAPIQPKEWVARVHKNGSLTEPALHGRTPLIAVMRALVASRLSDEVDVPEGLL